MAKSAIQRYLDPSQKTLTSSSFFFVKYLSLDHSDQFSDSWIPVISVAKTKNLGIT